MRVKARFPPETQPGMKFEVTASPLVNRFFPPPLFKDVLEMREQDAASMTIQPYSSHPRELIRHNNQLFVISEDFRSPVPLKFRGDVFIGYGYTADRRTPYVIEASPIP